MIGNTQTLGQGQELRRFSELIPKLTSLGKVKGSENILKNVRFVPYIRSYVCYGIHHTK